MRTVEEYRRILALWEDGQNHCEIARATGIPRATVRECIIRYGTQEKLETDSEARDTLALIKILHGRCDDPDQLRETYAYLLGLYLGDGSISKMPRVYRLRITLDAEYPRIIERCRSSVQRLLPENTIGLVENYYQGELSYIDVSASYKYWTLVFPQHGDGLKHNRVIVLETWQQRIIETYPLEFFRGLYHSDGSRYINRVKGRDYPRYQFVNKSTDIIRLFTDTCDQLKLHWTSKVRPVSAGGMHDIFISCRADVAFLDQHIGPKS